MWGEDLRVFSDTGVKLTFIYKSASRYEEVLFCFTRECYVLSDISIGNHMRPSTIKD